MKLDWRLKLAVIFCLPFLLMYFLMYHRLLLGIPLWIIILTTAFVFGFLKLAVKTLLYTWIIMILLMLIAPAFAKYPYNPLLMPVFLITGIFFYYYLSIPIWIILFTYAIFSKRTEQKAENNINVK